MTSGQILYLANDHALELSEMQNEATGAVVDAASVSATLYDAATGVEVFGQTWPLALPPVSGAPGTYRGTLSHALALVANRRYVAEINANAGAGLVARWRVPLVALNRTQ